MPSNACSCNYRVTVSWRTPRGEERRKRSFRTMCESLGWELGAVGASYPKEGVLRCEALCAIPQSKQSNSRMPTRKSNSASGSGMPGRVWKPERPVHSGCGACDLAFRRVDSAARQVLGGTLPFDHEGARFIGVNILASSAATFRSPIRELLV